MPELPEVETTRRGIAPHVAGKRIVQVRVHEPRLRWKVAADLAAKVAGRRVRAVTRRAKYLLLELDRGTLILHLGMSGNLRVLESAIPRRLHDHLDIELEGGIVLRFNDPRRFGSFHLADGPAAAHPLLVALGPEPLGEDFTPGYLQRVARRRRVAIKGLLMNSHVVVGVGNIYANEALFRAGVRPGRMAGRLKLAEITRIVDAVRDVLAMAIRVGGTTLRDYVGADGNPGYFRQQLFVYERAGLPCRRCGHAVRHRRQGQRSTYFCPNCQR
jgi:formamidopyrimidine-DNA glycosylase